MHDVASFGTLFAYDCALCARIYEGLDWKSIDFGFNIEHRNLTKKFWTILYRCLVVGLDQIFSNFLLNLFLSFNIIRVCIVEFEDSFLVRPLFVNDSFNFLSNQLL
jgi:hypothetical protein